MTWQQILKLLLTLAAQILTQLEPPVKPGLGAAEDAHSKKAEVKKIADGLQAATDAVRVLQKAAQ